MARHCTAALARAGRRHTWAHRGRGSGTAAGPPYGPLRGSAGHPPAGVPVVHIAAPGRAPPVTRRSGSASASLGFRGSGGSCPRRSRAAWRRTRYGNRTGQERGRGGHRGGGARAVSTGEDGFRRRDHHPADVCLHHDIGITCYSVRAYAQPSCFVCAGAHPAATRSAPACSASRCCATCRSASARRAAFSASASLRAKFSGRSS